jgi:hypothetical protein
MLGVGNGDRRSDTPTGTPAAFHGGAARLDDLQEIIENSIRYVFVEDPFVPEFLQVKLQALKFYALLVRHVSKHQDAKIRLTGLWANRSEFRASDFDGILSVWIRVVETFELVGKRCSRHGR